MEFSDFVPDDTPAHALKHPVNPFWRIFLYYFLPSAVSLSVYLILIVTDFALVAWYIDNDKGRWGTATLMLTFLPSIVGTMFTLSSPDRWPSEEIFTRANLRFLALNLWHVIGYPFAAIYRYIHQIFWSIEAMCANCAENSERMENATRILSKPNSMELYFFLQSYLHSAPQIFLQFYLLLDETMTFSEITSLQVLSIMMSLIRMATTTVSYQRFERRKTLGVHYPWASKISIRNSKRMSYAVSTPRKRASEGSSALENMKLMGIRPLPVDNNLDYRDDEVFEEPVSARNTIVKISNVHEEILVEQREYDRVSTSSSTIYEEPVTLRRDTTVKRSVSIVDNRMDIIEEDNPYNIEDMSLYVTPPSTPAPRPNSFYAIKNSLVASAEYFMDKIPKRRHDSFDIDLPVRVRRAAIKGVEQDDGGSKLISFLAWFLFITARVLVLASFSQFFIFECLYICLAHYALMTSLLMWNSWSENLHRKVFYLFLGYVYTFCLIEFKMKFIKVRLWYGCYFGLISIENFVLTTVWFWTSSYTRWWANFLLSVIVVASFLSYMCFAMYFMILRPKTVTVYPTNVSAHTSSTFRG